MPRNTAIQATLSAPRLGTYIAATRQPPPAPLLPQAQQLQTAVALYGWNAAISAVFLHPLHICEVTIRNAIADALGNLYGPNWPWQAGFVQSLANPAVGYRARQDLSNVANEVGALPHPTTGKVIPEVKFAFWEHMFTARYQATIWNSEILRVFPHFPAGTMPHQARALLYTELGRIRKLRNRIAHHEPIFQRNLQDDLDRLERLISFRCLHTLDWVKSSQMVRFLLNHRPA